MAAPRPECRSRVPDAIGRLGEEDLAARRRDAGLERGDERLEEARLDHHVVVEQQHRRRAALDRRLDPRVDATGEAGVPAHPDHDGLGELGLDRLGAAVARAVVDDDHLERRVVDPRERGETQERVVLAVPGEDDHRNGSRAISAIGAMIIDTYAPVRRMNSEIQPLPDPAAPVAAGEGSHAPAVLRNSALQIGGHVGAIALTAASTIVLTRFLGVDDYGRFTVLTVFLLIGASLSEFGLNGTAIRWFASGERPEDVFASLIGLRLVLSSAAAVIALAIFALYPHSETPLSAVILTTIAMVLAGVNLTIPTALQARLDFRLAVVLDLTARVVTFAVFVAAALIVTSENADRRLVAAGVRAPGRLPRGGRRRSRRGAPSLVPDRPHVPPGDVATAPARRGAARRRDDPRARELPARRARARAPPGLARGRDLRARLPLHGGGDPDRRLHHLRDLPPARP